MASTCSALVPLEWDFRDDSLWLQKAASHPLQHSICATPVWRHSLSTVGFSRLSVWTTSNSKARTHSWESLESAVLQHPSLSAWARDTTQNRLTMDTSERALPSSPTTPSGTVTHSDTSQSSGSHPTRSLPWPCTMESWRTIRQCWPARQQAMLASYCAFERQFLDATVYLTFINTYYFNV